MKLDKADEMKAPEKVEASVAFNTPVNVASPSIVKAPVIEVTPDAVSGEATNTAVVPLT